MYHMKHIRGKIEKGSACLICRLVLNRRVGRFCKRHSRQFWRLRILKTLKRYSDEELIQMIKTNTVPEIKVGGRQKFQEVMK